MCQLTSVARDDSLVRLVVVLSWSDLVEDGYHEDSSFAHTRLSLAKDILPLESHWDGFHLHF